MSDVGLSIIGTECKEACKGEPDLEKRIRKAMKVVAKGHWLFSDDDLLLRGALAGVLLAPETTEEEKTRLTKTLEGLRALSAMMSGVPVDLDAIAEQQKIYEPVPLAKWWHEEKAA